MALSLPVSYFLRSLWKVKQFICISVSDHKKIEPSDHPDSLKIIEFALRVSFRNLSSLFGY